MIKKVVTYGVYSNEKSIKNFENQIAEELKKHDDWKLERKYIDYTKGKRSRYFSFVKLLNQTMYRDIDIILIKNVKQFYQVVSNGIEFFINYLREKGIELIFLDEKINAFYEFGIMQMSILMLEKEKKENDKRSKVGNIGREIIEKENKKNEANKSRSNKMKELWKNEEYKKQMSERIKYAKRMKKLTER